MNKNTIKKKKQRKWKPWKCVYSTFSLVSTEELVHFLTLHNIPFIKVADPDRYDCSIIVNDFPVEQLSSIKSLLSNYVN